MFGGGSNTDYPLSGSTILVTGITCDGAAGNSNANSPAVTFLSPIYDSQNTNIVNILGVVALSAPSGGADPDTIAQIKVKAPAFYTTQNKATEAGDYAYLAFTQVPGVEEAIAWGGEEVGRYGEVFVCVAGSNRASVPQSLLDSVYELLYKKRTIPMLVNVVAPKLVTADITMDVFAAPTYDLNLAKNEAIASLSTYFDNLKIGSPLQYSDAVSQIGENASVDNVNFKVTITVTGTANANQVRADLISYADLDTLEIWKNGVKIWGYADGGAVIDNEQLVVPVVVASGEVQVKMKSKYNDVYVRREQALILGVVTTNARKANSPES
jgi:hypothetical protein